MYIKACQLQHILGVIEVLSLECGVSVSKKVKEEDEAWVEEAVFQSFTDKGLGEVCKKLKIKEEEEFCTTEQNNLRRNSNCWWETAGTNNGGDDDDKPGYEDGEEAIEVVPKVSRSVRNSVANDEDEGMHSISLFRNEGFMLDEIIFYIYENAKLLFPFFIS